MSTRLTYTGDGYQTSFAISFPYLSTSHVKVYVNETLQLSPMNYTVAGGQVIFSDPPGVDAAIVIQRQTSPSDALVDFQDGSTLKAEELDTAYLHNFYLSQEYSDGFTKLIQDAFVALASANGVIVTEPDEVIMQLVQTMLADAAAATLQQRVNDIDTNAESIIQLGESLQTQINTLAQGVAANVYIQANEPVPGVGGIPDPILEGSRWYDTDDNNAPYIYQSGAWVSIQDPRIGQAVADISVLQTDVAGNAAAIVDEAAARSGADGAFAATLALLGAQNGGQTAFILNSNTVKIDSDVGDTFATRFSSLATADSNNAANITNEQNARITADGVLAADIALIGARNGAANAFILNSATVKLDSDGGQTLAQKIAELVASDGTNAANISNEQTARISADGVLAADIALIGAKNGGATAFILNSNTVKLDSDGGPTIASKITTLEAADSSNSAAITTINTVTIPGIQSDVSDLEAKYGVTLNVNGYITGFIQNNNGTSGSFVILADKFAVVDPNGGGGQTPLVPFEISGGKINIRGDVNINGSLLLNGTVVGTALVAGTIGSTQIGANAITTDKLNASAVTAAKIAANTITADKLNVTNLAAINANMGSITAGNITLNTSGYIKGGQTAYNTGTGFFLGYDTAAYKFSIGNPGTGNYLTWDGTNLSVSGIINVGTWAVSDNLQFSADTERTATGFPGEWQEKKKFAIYKDGTVRMKFDSSRSFTPGGTVTTTPQTRIKRNSTVINTYTETSNVYATRSNDIAVSQGDYITVETKMGEYYDGAEYIELPSRVRNARLYGDVVFTNTAAVITN